MPRRAKQHHYIYKTTCLVTGKFYVGMHSTDNLDDGYLGSGKILLYSINKHGGENHRKEILEHCPSREALKLREKEIVNEELLANPLNINLKYGGEGGWDHVKNQSAAGKAGAKALKEKLKDPAQYRLWQERAKAWNISAYASGIKIPSGWSKAAAAAAATPEANAKRSSTMKDGQKQAGIANSQFGTCWVTNGVPIKIKKQDLDSYLSNGYVRGRTKTMVLVV